MAYKKPNPALHGGGVTRLKGGVASQGPRKGQKYKAYFAGGQEYHSYGSGQTVAFKRKGSPALNERALAAGKQNQARPQVKNLVAKQYKPGLAENEGTQPPDLTKMRETLLKQRVGKFAENISKRQLAENMSKQRTQGERMSPIASALAKKRKLPRPGSQGR
jgi:hypothetical protein